MNKFKSTVIAVIMFLFSFSIFANSTETTQFSDTMKTEQEKTKEKGASPQKKTPASRGQLPTPYLKRAANSKLSQDDQIEYMAHSLFREMGFKQTEELILNKLRRLHNEKKALEIQIESLRKIFSGNEANLVKLEERLRLDSGSLGSVVDVVRQFVDDLKEERIDSFSSIPSLTQDQKKARLDVILDKISIETQLPSLDLFSSLRDSLHESLEHSAQISHLNVDVRDNNGIVKSEDIMRLGDLVLVNEAGYLLWDQKNNQAIEISQQPQDGLNSLLLSDMEKGDLLLLDPSKGKIFQKIQESPSLFSRFEDSGWVGKIISLILLVGLGISFVRGAALYQIHIQIKEQKNALQSPRDNPLGRLLRVYHFAPMANLESLELRMMQVIIDEQKEAEKGLSMIKLFAALAPMLGLLGTVMGMIETFGVIVQHGNGDPRIMASGISMALITTVMGLIAAMPLLLTHNILSTQVATLNGILEKIGVGLVAQQYEKRQEHALIQKEQPLLNTENPTYSISEVSRL